MTLLGFAGRLAGRVAGRARRAARESAAAPHTRGKRAELAAAQPSARIQPPGGVRTRCGPSAGDRLRGQGPICRSNEAARRSRRIRSATPLGGEVARQRDPQALQRQRRGRDTAICRTAATATPGGSLRQRPTTALARCRGDARDQSSALQRAQRDVERSLGDVQLDGQLSGRHRARVSGRNRGKRRLLAPRQSVIGSRRTHRALSGGDVDAPKWTLHGFPP